MVIHNSRKILKELLQIEEQIAQIEKVIYNKDLNIDSEKLLEEILKTYCRESQYGNKINPLEFKRIDRFLTLIKIFNFQ